MSCPVHVGNIAAETGGTSAAMRPDGGTDRSEIIKSVLLKSVLLIHSQIDGILKYGFVKSSQSLVGHELNNETSENTTIMQQSCKNGEAQFKTNVGHETKYMKE